MATIYGIHLFPLPDVHLVLYYCNSTVLYCYSCSSKRVVIIDGQSFVSLVHWKGLMELLQSTWNSINSIYSVEMAIDIL